MSPLAFCSQKTLFPLFYCSPLRLTSLSLGGFVGGAEHASIHTAGKNARAPIILGNIPNYVYNYHLRHIAATKKYR
jgi:hypothetical protein